MLVVGRSSRAAFLAALLLLTPPAGGTAKTMLDGADQTPLGDRPPEKTGFIPALTLDGETTVAWRFPPPAGQRDRQPGLCDPATAGGMLFFGDDNGVVRALTAREGVPIWTHEHGERVFFPPTCDDERLFFTTRKGITALASGSGIHLWHRPVRHSAGRCVTWKQNDTVYFADSDGWMYALESTTGQERWKSGFVDDAPKDPPGFDGNQARFEGTATRPTGIATDGERVYQSVFDQCRVVSFEGATGARKVTFQTRGWIFGDPAVDESRP